MADGDILLLENWLGTGARNSWSESVGAGSSFDDDADPAAAGDPARWGAECLFANAIVNEDATGASVDMGDALTKYLSVEFLVDAEALDNDEGIEILHLRHDGSTSLCQVLFFQSGGVFLLVDVVSNDGTPTLRGTVSVLLDTVYLLEVEWDVSGDTFQAWLDGTSYDGSLAITGTPESTPWEFTDLSIGTPADAEGPIDVYYGPVVVREGKRARKAPYPRHWTLPFHGKNVGRCG